MILSRKKRYLQIALNSSLSDAQSIISKLPISDRIIIEAGTPLIKQYGMDGVNFIYRMWSNKLMGTLDNFSPQTNGSTLFQNLATLSNYGFSDITKRALNGKAKATFFKSVSSKKTHFQQLKDSANPIPYVVADLKTMDRAQTEVAMVKQAGASGVICLGQAPVETINSFIDSCKQYELDSMVDMMNVEYPITILRKLKNPPDVVLLHRGVDEEALSKDKGIPYLQINKVLSSYNVMVSVAGGDTIREVQRAIFNDADIVVVWKEFYHSTVDTGQLAQEFLEEIK